MKPNVAARLAFASEFLPRRNRYLVAVAIVATALAVLFLACACRSGRVCEEGPVAYPVEQSTLPAVAEATSETDAAHDPAPTSPPSRDLEPVSTPEGFVEECTTEGCRLVPAPPPRAGAVDPLGTKTIVELVDRLREADALRTRLQTSEAEGRRLTGVVATLGDELAQGRIALAVAKAERDSATSRVTDDERRLANHRHLAAGLAAAIVLFALGYLVRSGRRSAGQVARGGEGGQQ